MRRSSLVAPLLLIGIGALFLARNLYPELPLTDYLARYWPYILIVWGTLRLVEILYWANTAKPVPTRGISGGEWLLIVFLCMIGMSVHFVHGRFAEGMGRWWPERIPWNTVQLMGERFDYPVAVQKTASGTAHIVIEEFRGDLKVTGSDADLVKIVGRKSIRAVDKNTADHADSGSSVEIGGDANQITVRLREPVASGPLISAALEVTVPKGASLEARRRDGDVSIANMAGPVDVRGSAANLDVHQMSGPVTIEGTYTGDVTLKDLAKPVRFKSPRTDFNAIAVPGEIHIDPANFNADGLTGPVRLNSRSRDVRLRNFRDALQVDLERGDLNLEPAQMPLSPIEAKLRSGDTVLVLPDAAGFSIKATTRSGEITNSLGPGFKIDSDGRRETLTGAAGGGPPIMLEAERGSISVRKGSAVPSVKGTSHPLETINQ
jgi:hypothetical protein